MSMHTNTHAQNTVIELPYSNLEVGLVIELTVMLGKYLDIGGDSENIKKIKLATGGDVSPVE